MHFVSLSTMLSMFFVSFSSYFPSMYTYTESSLNHTMKDDTDIFLEAQKENCVTKAILQGE